MHSACHPSLDGYTSSTPGFTVNGLILDCDEWGWVLNLAYHPSLDGYMSSSTLGFTVNGLMLDWDG